MTILTELRRKVMQIIYATGQPRMLEFSITDRRHAVPAGAIIFATCAGDRILSPQLDEYLFAAITDEEYYTYLTLLRDVLEMEKERLNNWQRATTRYGFFKQLWTRGIVAALRNLFQDLERT